MRFGTVELPGFCPVDLTWSSGGAAGSSESDALKAARLQTGPSEDNGGAVGLRVGQGGLHEDPTTPTPPAGPHAGLAASRSTFG